MQQSMSDKEETRRHEMLAIKEKEEKEFFRDRKTKIFAVKRDHASRTRLTSRDVRTHDD